MHERKFWENAPEKSGNSENAKVDFLCYFFMGFSMFPFLNGFFKRKIGKSEGKLEKFRELGKIKISLLYEKTRMED